MVKKPGSTPVAFVPFQRYLLSVYSRVTPPIILSWFGYNHPFDLSWGKKRAGFILDCSCYPSVVTEIFLLLFSSFADAKKCLNRAHEESCNFDQSSSKATMFGDDNPFCENGKDPLRSGVNGGQGTILFLFITSIAFLVGP